MESNPETVVSLQGLFPHLHSLRVFSLNITFSIWKKNK